MASDNQGNHGRRAFGRHFWREKSHQESHSQPQAEQLTPVAAHPLASSQPPVVVSDSPQMAQMIEHLKAAGSFAFDSEFIGEMSYTPKLCLVQVATSHQVFIVDPLAGLDLTGLWGLIVEPAIEKIVLAGQQDFGPAVAATGRPPANIMDLQIAAGLIHADYPLSLARLLQEFVGISLGKGHTFSHWDRRPLSAVQMRYAADDVRYLPAARQAIGAKLAALGRADWASQECAAAMEDVALYRPGPESLYLRVRGRDRLGRRRLAVLRELAIVRDQAARQEDLPARTVLKDSILVSMARRPPQTLSDLASFKGLPRPVEAAYGQQIIAAAARALAMPEPQWPPAEPEETYGMRDGVDRIFAELGRLCQERSVAAALVASRKDIVRICHAVAAGQSAEQFRLFGGWRKELLADWLEQML